MICTRCNAVSGDTDKCSMCGTRLRTLASGQRRGWVSLVAGAFMVVLMAVVWIFVAHLVATGRVTQMDPATEAFFGRTYVAFGLVVLSGLVAMVGATMQIQSGVRNRALSFAVVVLFAAAVGTVLLGSGPLRSN
jgi:hypothetical protein